MTDALVPRDVTGTIDGLNRDFVTDPYVATSLAYLLNGILDNDPEETDPSVGTFKTREPPIVGDVLFVLGRFS